MKLQSKIELLKFTSTVLNFFLLVLGVSVGSCGLWILFDSSVSFVSSGSDELRVVALVLLAAAVLLLGVCLLQVIAAQTESRLLLLPVGGLLLMLVLAQIFTSFLLFLSRTKISAAMTTAVDKLIENYPKPSESPLLDNIQHYGACCGRMGPSDWLNNWFVQNQSEVEILPCSCFRSNRHNPRSFCSRNQTLDPDLLPGNSSFSQGCEVALSDWLMENLWTVIGMNLGLILIQVLQIVSVSSLFQSFGAKSLVKSSFLNQDEPDLDQDQVYSDQDQEQIYSDQDLLHQDQDRDHDHRAYDGPLSRFYGDQAQVQVQDWE